MQNPNFSTCKLNLIADSPILPTIETVVYIMHHHPTIIIMRYIFFSAFYRPYIVSDLVPECVPKEVSYGEKRETVFQSMKEVRSYELPSVASLKSSGFTSTMHLRRYHSTLIRTLKLAASIRAVLQLQSDYKDEHVAG